MAEPIAVTISLDLDRYLARTNVRYDEEGYEVGGEAQTVEDLVLDLAAQQVVAKLDRDVTTRLADRVRELRDEAIREQVAPIIEQALAGPIQRTNLYGEPQGEATTLREVIAKDAAAALKLTPRDQRGHRSSYDMNPATKVMYEEVDKAVAREVKAIVDQVKDETRAAIAAAASEAIAKAAS